MFSVGVLSFEDDVPWDKFTPETKERIYQKMIEHDCMAIWSEMYYLDELVKEKYPEIQTIWVENMYVDPLTGKKDVTGISTPDHPVNNLRSYLNGWYYFNNCDV